jgi:hypothetical protein
MAKGSRRAETYKTRMMLREAGVPKIKGEAYTGMPTRYPGIANQYQEMLQAETGMFQVQEQKSANLRAKAVRDSHDKARAGIFQQMSTEYNNRMNPGLASEMSGLYATPGGTRPVPSATAASLAANRPNPMDALMGDRTFGAYSSARAGAAGAGYAPKTEGLFHGPIQEIAGEKVYGGRGNYSRTAQIAKNKASKQAAKAARGPRSALGMAYQGTNAASKALLGASVGKLAIGGGLAVGALALIDTAIGRDPFSDAGAAVGGAQRFNRAMNEASRPSYGASAFQQSTQGLVFGLHNARTAY